MCAARIGMLCCLVAAGCGGDAPGPGELTGAVAPTEPGVEIPNPQYASWADFPVGTAVVIRAVTRADGDPGETVTTTTLTLREVSPVRVVVESRAETRRYDGHVTANPPTRADHSKTLRLPGGANADRPAGVTAEGTEAVTAGGRVYAAKWHETRDRNEAGDMVTRTWMSPAVPGGLVRSVVRTAAIGKTTTTEVVEVRRAAQGG
ncbi:MAG TPA: hypothetical protein VM597_04785 [Gemmataceae bacterium]|nr:hypothetical protein [Gemmataceae bacterium]